MRVWCSTVPLERVTRRAMAPSACFMNVVLRAAVGRWPASMLSRNARTSLFVSLTVDLPHKVAGKLPSHASRVSASSAMVWRISSSCARFAGSTLPAGSFHPKRAENRPGQWSAAGDVNRPKVGKLSGRVDLLRPERRYSLFDNLRHSAATVFLRAGVDVHRVQRLMRHASVTTTTKIYAHLLTEDLRGPVAAAWAPAPTEALAQPVALAAENEVKPEAKPLVTRLLPEAEILVSASAEAPAQDLENTGKDSGARHRLETVRIFGGPGVCFRNGSSGSSGSWGAARQVAYAPYPCAYPPPSAIIFLRASHAF